MARNRDQAVWLLEIAELRYDLLDFPRALEGYFAAERLVADDDSAAAAEIRAKAAGGAQWIWHYWDRPELALRAAKRGLRSAQAVIDSNPPLLIHATLRYLEAEQTVAETAPPSAVTAVLKSYFALAKELAESVDYSEHALNACYQVVASQTGPEGSAEIANKAFALAERACRAGAIDSARFGNLQTWRMKWAIAQGDRDLAAELLKTQKRRTPPDPRHALSHRADEAALAAIGPEPALAAARYRELISDLDRAGLRRQARTARAELAELST